VHDRYVVGRVIGRGSFAQVMVAYDVLTDTKVVRGVRPMVLKAHQVDTVIGHS
jgi:serine/threonine protein kinase